MTSNTCEHEKAPGLEPKALETLELTKTQILNLDMMGSTPKKIVLVIAATDPIDGAGLTSDLKTLAAFGVAGAGAVTAVTWQNCHHFGGLQAVEPATLAAELEAIYAEYGAARIEAVKIGAIPNDKTAQVVVSFLKQYQSDREALGVPAHVIWDPVGSATKEATQATKEVSQEASKDATQEALTALLLQGSVDLAGTNQAKTLTTMSFKNILNEMAQVVSVITPNIPEALAMSGLTPPGIKTAGDWFDFLTKVAVFFLDAGFKQILLKGGHADKLGLRDGFHLPCNVDLLSDATHNYWLLDRRIIPAAGQVHGTGCALASAMAAMLAAKSTRFDDLLSAAVIAKAFVVRGIREALNESPEGLASCVRRPLYSHELGADLPYCAANRAEVDWFLAGEAFLTCPFKLGFYVVVDSSAWIERLCKAGVKTFQLRIKDPVKLQDKAFIKAEIERAVALGKKYEARVLVDDLWQEAAALGAWGVHLGQEDLDTATLTQIRAAGLRLGVSTHSYGELARALLLAPSYVALGHIFPTQSKVMPSAPQGLFHLRSYVEALGDKMPTVAIGGIKLNTVEAVAKTGVGSVAVITAITKASDPEAAVKAWQEALHE